MVQLVIPSPWKKSKVSGILDVDPGNEEVSNKVNDIKSIIIFFVFSDSFFLYVILRTVLLTLKNIFVTMSRDQSQNHDRVFLIDKFY